MSLIARKSASQYGNKDAYVNLEGKITYTMMPKRFDDTGKNWSNKAIKEFWRRLEYTLRPKVNKIGGPPLGFNKIDFPDEQQKEEKYGDYNESPVTSNGLLSDLLDDELGESEEKEDHRKTKKFGTMLSRIKMVIGELQLTALVDTGASISIMKDEVAKYINSRAPSKITRNFDSTAFRHTVKGSVHPTRLNSNFRNLANRNVSYNKHL